MVNKKKKKRKKKFYGNIFNYCSVIAANGNIGTSGIFLPSSPATGKDVIAVGSIQSEYVPGYVLKVYAKQTLSICKYLLHKFHPHS